MKQKLIVMSQDALTYEDVEYLKTLPNYKKYLEGGARIKKVKSIYPTITYPCHVSMSTGVYPEKHGVLSNMELVPGGTNVNWNWFYKSNKWKDDIFKAAKRKGLSTAAIFWPVTGNHPDIDYLIDEYWGQSDETDVREIFKRAGSSEEVLDIICDEIGDCKIRSHPETDDFIIRCTKRFIEEFQPDLIMIHPANVDTYRHQSGLFNDKITKGVEETDRFIGEIMESVEKMGLLECTNFVLTSDHGMLDIKRCVSPNVKLFEAGLIEADEKGRVTNWRAYCQSGGTSALVYIKDKNDKEAYYQSYEILKQMADEGVYGFNQIFKEEEIKKQEHLGGNFAFALETDGFTSFGESVLRPITGVLDFSDYRYGTATHGHLPEKGIQPIFSAKGPAFKENVTIERANLVDEAPTYSKILGLDLMDYDGRILEELIK